MVVIIKQILGITLQATLETILIKVNHLVMMQ